VNPRFHGAILIALTLLAPDASAHDVPNDVLVKAFLKPDGQRLRLLVRVPMAAMRDVDFPTGREGSLDLVNAEPRLREAAETWIADQLVLFENDVPLGEPKTLAVQASLPSDLSFADYDKALAHVTGARLPATTELVWNQWLLDAAFEYQIQSDTARFSFQSALARLGHRVVTVVHFLPQGSPERVLELSGDPGLVQLDPSWHQAAFQFVKLGFLHILDGTDHLLFLFCLVIPFRRFRTLILVVTSFTVAHSITLIASAFDLAPDALWFPPLIETLIAVSIVYMALENIVAPQLQRRWLISFGFGLVHGFGFSFALRETLQFAGSHLLASLLSFNVGVELGQIAVLVVLLPLLDLVFRFVMAERIGTIVLSALVAHTGWHWMLERAEVLRQFTFRMPALDAALLAAGLRWLLILIVAFGLVWGVVRLLRPAAKAEPTTETPE
jgi:hypothetical protein